MNPSGQAYTEYTVILAVTLGLGFGALSLFIGFDALHDLYFAYYGSLANFLNLPFF